MIRRISVTIIIFFVLFSCTKNIDGIVATNTALSNFLLSSDTAAKINGDSLFSKADVWRDFMPDIGKKGSGLLCANRLYFKDSIPIPSGLKVKTLYVINGNQVWTNKHPEVQSDLPLVITAVMRDGPKWGPDIFVDVVCEFEIANKTYRIVAKHQKIEATI